MVAQLGRCGGERVVYDQPAGRWEAGGPRSTRVRRRGREAAESGADPTDYTTSPTARSFVPYYAQRLSMACVMYGASAILKSLKRKAARRRSAAVVA